MEDAKAAQSLIDMTTTSEDKEKNKENKQDADTTKQRIQKRQEQRPKAKGALLQKMAQQLQSGNTPKALTVAWPL